MTADRPAGLLYRMLRTILFTVDPERIHRVTVTVMLWALRIPGLRRMVEKATTVRDPILASTVLGLDFPAPLGLAAGFDKDAGGVDAWGRVGFGFAEIGTITGQAQPGNPAPRLFRLPADRALINRMGFNNAGADVAAAKLARRRSTVPIGINIGKTKTVALDDAVDDYLYSTARLAPLADFLIVNVSSPNTPGLRDLQAVESLRPLLAAVRGAADCPVLVKIAPDLADEDVDAVADLALELDLAGIIATNTTISRTGLATAAAEITQIGAGGLSGPPVAARSLAVLRRLRARVGDRLVLISVGGIETADQAYERILAGASLVQGFTGMIYGGPLWARRIHRGLAARLRADGYRSLAEAVGADAAGPETQEDR